MIFRLKMVIFHCYVSLPKGTFWGVFSPFTTVVSLSPLFSTESNPSPERIRAAAEDPTIRPEVLLIWDLTSKPSFQWGFPCPGFPCLFFYLKARYDYGRICVPYIFKQPLLILFFEFLTITWDLNGCKLRKEQDCQLLKHFVGGWTKQSCAQSFWRVTAKMMVSIRKGNPP